MTSKPDFPNVHLRLQGASVALSEGFPQIAGEIANDVLKLHAGQPQAMHVVAHAVQAAAPQHGVIERSIGGAFFLQKMKVGSVDDRIDIIGPLVAMKTADLLRFTEMTGDLVKAMRACPQPIVAAVDGICAGAGAIMAMASDLRIATPEAKVAFLFNRVGLAGCDMGACAILPRIIGQGRASELLYTGRAMSGTEGERWGFFNRLTDSATLLETARDLARRIADGPTFATGLTKRMLHMEWAMGVDDAIEAEAVAQALCMKTEDFGRAYRAFAAKEKPVFEGD